MRRYPASAPRSRTRRARSPAYLALAAAQPTPARRSRASALVCLGAGAGLIRSDLRNARGTDIVRRSGGVIVDVRGGRAPRAVPVLARYHAPLLEAAAFADGNFLTGGTEPERGNITNPLIRSLAGGGGLPALDTSRLRATWLADVAQLIGLPAFMRAGEVELPGAATVACCAMAAFAARRRLIRIQRIPGCRKATSSTCSGARASACSSPWVQGSIR